MREKETRKDLEEKAFVLWGRHGETYRNGITKYQELLEERRKLGIKPLDAINERDIQDYPEIKLLKCETEEKLRKALERLSDTGLKYAIMEIEYETKYNYTYTTIFEKIKQFERQAKNIDSKKSMYMMNPDFRRV